MHCLQGSGSLGKVEEVRSVLAILQRDYIIEGMEIWQQFRRVRLRRQGAKPCHLISSAR